MIKKYRIVPYSTDRWAIESRLEWDQPVGMLWWKKTKRFHTKWEQEETYSFASEELAERQIDYLIMSRNKIINEASMIERRKQNVKPRIYPS